MQMDALISHSSKSYYACVGESTHAYQSPSKDLSAINNRLNGYAFSICLQLLRFEPFFFFLFPFLCYINYFLIRIFFSSVPESSEAP